MSPRLDNEAAYLKILHIEDQTQRALATAALAERDLYFLLTVVCRRRDCATDWVYARCREVEQDPDGYLDLWARYHYKSSVITFGLTLQDIIRDPEITVGIFSHTRPIAKAFLRQLKAEMETNPLLPDLWPGVFWRYPQKQAPKWSEDDGLIVRRKGNPKEATVEAWGLVDGQPTGKHYALRVYDDVVTRESATTPEMIAKTTSAWELSLNLKTAQGGKARYVGTRYHWADTYDEILKRGAVKKREYPAEDENGVPAFLSRPRLDQERRDMGVATYSAQMLLRPTADSITAFQLAWLRYHDGIKPPGAGMNRYILVDPAHSKRKDSDWTSIWVLGAGEDLNWHVCDVVRDRLNLGERVAALIRLHRIWRPLGVGYERYGLQADIEAIQQEQGRQNYRFDVIELAGTLGKDDRISRLLPLFQAGRIWLPRTLHYTQYDGLTVDLMHYFVNLEYLPYPAARFKDMLDSLSRVCDEDLQVAWPEAVDSAKDRYSRGGRARQTSWMAA